MVALDRDHKALTAQLDEEVAAEAEETARAELRAWQTQWAQQGAAWGAGGPG